MDEQRACQCPDGSYDLETAQSFSYDALSKEVFIGNVYLKVYNDQPDSEISEPEAFCNALIDFISSLVHTELPSVSEDQNLIEDSSSSNDIPELQSSVAEPSLIEGHSDHQPSSEGMKKEECSLIDHLQLGLTSLQVIIWSM